MKFPLAVAIIVLLLAAWNVYESFENLRQARINIRQACETNGLLHNGCVNTTACKDYSPLPVCR